MMDKMRKLYHSKKVLLLCIHHHSLVKNIAKYTFVVPNISGMPIFRFGLTFLSKANSIRLNSIDWANTPKLFAQRGTLLKSIWDTTPYWLQSWVGSAKHFAADFNHTYCISHFEDNGLMSIGSQDWSDYSVQSNLIFSLHESAGIVVYAKGLLNYIAVVFKDGNTVQVIENKMGQIKVLQSFDFSYMEDVMYDVSVFVKKGHLTFKINDQQFGETLVNRECGAAGFVVSKGTIVARDFVVKRL